MVREIITYPTPPSTKYATDVRVFNENIVALIDDLKDTIEAKNLEGLAAFQIGNCCNVVVIKRGDGSFVDLLNPRLIKGEGKVTTVEKTAYFGDLSANVTRHEKIRVVYQDRYGADRSLQAQGAEAILIQRKIDYAFGSTFLQKLSKEEKKLFEAKLEFGSDLAISESCPTTFFRDKILKVIAYLMGGMLLLVALSLFSNEQTDAKLWACQLYASYGVLLLNIVYFFYARYEGEKYSSCASCQIGNIVGTTAISLFKLTLLMTLSYFVVSP